MFYGAGDPRKRTWRMASGGENRLKSYKTKGLDAEELRKRREDEGLVLRKSKREEQVCVLFD